MDQIQAYSTIPIETMKDGSIVTIGFGSDAANQSTGILSLFSCTGDLIWTKTLVYQVELQY